MSTTLPSSSAAPSSPAGAPATPVTVEIPALNTLVTLAICVTAIAALDLAQEVLVPITLSVLLSFVLAPLASLLRRLRLGRVPSVLLAVMVALGLILAIGGLIGTQIADLVADVPRYQYTVEQKLQTVRAMTVGRLSGVIGGLGHQLEMATAPPPVKPPANPGPASLAPMGSATAPATAPRAPVQVEVHQPDPTPWDLARRILGPILGPLSTTAIVFIVAIFMLLQREDLRDRLIRLFGSGDLHRTTQAMNDAAKRLSRYFLAQLAVNMGFGVVIALGLLVIGVPSPVLWGILAGLLRFLPYLGAPLAAVLPMALAAAVDPGWSMLIWTGGLFLAAEATTGQVIEPMLYGRSTGLSPVSVVVAATFWTWLWGPIGLIMATPLTLCLVVLGRHVPRLEFLEVLLGDRPALTPVESFYQRLLAGDADEAFEQAEAVLRERSLSSYYDEVALPGLRMAADDRLRGVLRDRQILRIQETFATVLGELGSHEDTDPDPPRRSEPDAVVADRADEHLPAPIAAPPHAPPPDRLSAAWRGEAAVLCVAGRGPLDLAAAGMLAQLVAKHGLSSRILEHAGTSPQLLPQTDLSAVAMLCICYLRTEGTPSHLRALVRRLRRVRRDIPIMVGLWPAGEEALDDARHQAAMGADHYVGTLHDAVSICVAAAEATATAAPEAVTEPLPDAVHIAG